MDSGGGGNVSVARFWAVTALIRITKFPKCSYITLIKLRRSNNVVKLAQLALFNK